MDIVNRGYTIILKHWRYLPICGIIVILIRSLLLQLLPKVHTASSGTWQQYT